MTAKQVDLMKMSLLKRPTVEALFTPDVPTAKKKKTEPTAHSSNSKQIIAPLPVDDPTVRKHSRTPVISGRSSMPKIRKSIETPTAPPPKFVTVGTPTAPPPKFVTVGTPTAPPPKLVTVETQTAPPPKLVSVATQTDVLKPTKKGRQSYMFRAQNRRDERRRRRQSL